MGLAHDATVAAFLGAMRIIDRNETVHGPKLALEIRHVRFTGGSGDISFDENGDRPGYSGNNVAILKRILCFQIFFFFSFS